MFLIPELLNYLQIKISDNISAVHYATYKTGG